MLFGYDQGVMSGLFSAGQFSADFPKLAQVAPLAPANPHSSPSNPQFNSNVQGAVTAVSLNVTRHLKITGESSADKNAFTDLRNWCSVWLFDCVMEGRHDW